MPDTEIEMYDASILSRTDLAEIASYIRRDNLAYVNGHVKKVNAKKSFYTEYGKRLFDIVISSVALLVTFPVNLIIAIITIFDVGFPIVFKQKRIGKDERPFVIYKFRNMTNDTDVNGELLPADQRTTKWGKFVRKTSLDELLNFVSIFNGSMSVIGPRPLLDYYVERLNDRHRGIFNVKPGLECPGLHKADHVLSWQERLDNYVWYVENCSFMVDVKLAIRVVEIAFDKKSTVLRANAIHGGLLGYDRNGNVIYTKRVPRVYIEEYCSNHGFKNLDEAVDARG